MSPTSNDAHRDDRPSPSRTAIDSRDLHQSRPPPRQVNRSFDLEPNPFEQSFSSTRTEPADKKNDDKSQNSGDDAPSKSKQDNDPKPVLPSLAALSSPSDGFSWTDLAGSLRSGPLSPAMLQGPQQPQQQSSSNPLSLNPYDSTRPFGRTGLTPSTGLTPLVGGPVNFPPPSPNTAAFLAMVTNSSSAPPQLNPTPATITPNTLSAITGMLNPAQTSQSSGAVAPSATTSSSVSASIPAPVSHQQQEQQQHSLHSYQYGSGPNNFTANPTATSTAANGLFLLSQAHQELAKREEAQARADANSGVRRNAKRKSIDVGPAPTATRSQPKRPRANSSRGGKRGKGSAGSQEDDDSGEEDDNNNRASAEPEKPAQANGTKKPETEEEKRRNFLERNRQAALKCRQRKKAWLASLQAKVEYLTNENERLSNALIASREEISRLNALLGGAGPPQTGMSVNSQPVSVAVTLPSVGKSVQAQTQGPPVSVVNGRGYGY